MGAGGGIYDLSQRQPQRLESVLVDTNIWIFFTDVLTGHPKAERYTSLIGRMLRSQIRLLYSPLSLMEMAHVIESNLAKADKVDLTQDGARKRFRSENGDKLNKSVLGA